MKMSFMNRCLTLPLPCNRVVPVPSLTREGGWRWSFSWQLHKTETNYLTTPTGPLLFSGGTSPKPGCTRRKALSPSLRRSIIKQELPTASSPKYFTKTCCGLQKMLIKESTRDTWMQRAVDCLTNPTYSRNKRPTDWRKVVIGLPLGAISKEHWEIRRWRNVPQILTVHLWFKLLTSDSHCWPQIHTVHFWFTLLTSDSHSQPPIHTAHLLFTLLCDFVCVIKFHNYNFIKSIKLMKPLLLKSDSNRRDNNFFEVWKTLCHRQDLGPEQTRGGATVDKRVRGLMAHSKEAHETLFICLGELDHNSTTLGR